MSAPLRIRHAKLATYREQTGLTTEQRLACALQALEFYGGAYAQAGEQGALVEFRVTFGAQYPREPHPYWAGAAAVAGSALAERFAPLAHGIWDDNWMIVATALSILIAAKLYVSV